METSISSASHPESFTRYDNNYPKANGMGENWCTYESKNSRPASGIKEESIYHRIDKFDQEQLDFEQIVRPIPPRRLPTTPENNGYLTCRNFENDGYLSPSFVEKENNRGLLLRIGLAVIVVTVVALVSSVVYIWLSCYQEWLCTSEENVCTDCHPCDAEIIINYGGYGNTSCNLDLQDATAMLLQTNRERSMMQTLEDGTTNVTVNGMVLAISRQLTNLSVDIIIQNVNCSIIGTYVLTLANATHNETFTVHIQVNPTTQQCPCHLEFDAGKEGFIQCVTPADVDVSIIHRGTYSDVILANNTLIADIVNNGDLSENGSKVEISATTFTSGVLLRISFSPVNCDHSGTYIITLGSTSYDTTFDVKSYPRSPVIGTDHNGLGGLVERYYSEICCEAFVGCGPPPTFYHKVFDEYQPIQRELLNLTRDIQDTGTTYYVARIFRPEFLTSSYNGSQYMCSFEFEEQLYQSEIYTALIVPRNYCEIAGIKIPCNGKHPYDCGKFITCTSRPWERVCGDKKHFYFKHHGDTCDGHCGYPNEANCEL